MVKIYFLMVLSLFLLESNQPLKASDHYEQEGCFKRNVTNNYHKVRDSVAQHQEECIEAGDKCIEIGEKCSDVGEECVKVGKITLTILETFKTIKNFF